MNSRVNDRDPEREHLNDFLWTEVILLPSGNIDLAGFTDRGHFAMDRSHFTMDEGHFRSRACYGRRSFSLGTIWSFDSAQIFARSYETGKVNNSSTDMVNRSQDFVKVNGLLRLTRY